MDEKTRIFESERRSPCAEAVEGKVFISRLKFERL